MTTVDDLVISLRIDDTSNLGKLQKQLTALVGRDGTKKLDFGGIGGIAKTDIGWIKNKLMEISPAMLTTEVKGLKESAKTTLRQMMDKTYKETILAKYGIKSSEWKDWMLYLSTAITEEGTNIDKLANFIEIIADFIKGGARLGGRQKTRVSSVRKALPEDFIEAQFVKSLREAGFRVRSQYQYYKIDPVKVDKYRNKIDKILSKKEVELKEGYPQVKLTEDIKNDIIDLARKEEDSDIYVEKALTNLLGISEDATKELIDKLNAGKPDTVLEILAFLRVLASEEYDGLLLLSQDLHELIKTDLKSKSIGKWMPKRSDVKLSKEAIDKLMEKSDEFNIKFIGDVEDLKNATGEINVEIKKVFDKTVADSDVKNANRSKQLGKDLIVYLNSAATKQGEESLKFWQDASENKVKYVRIEATLTDIAKALGVGIDMSAKLEEANVFKEWDKDADTIDDIKNDITQIIHAKAKEGPESLWKILKELFGLEDHVTGVARTQDEVLDALQRALREGITIRSEKDPFKL